MRRHLVLPVEKIFKVWEEMRNSKELEDEVHRFREWCQGYTDTVVLSINNYKKMYKAYTPYIEEFPILTSFLKEVKQISNEAYDYLTEGHDIINLKEYLSFVGKQSNEITNELIALKTYSVFIEHAFIKLLHEPNIDKRYIMLRGLVGM